MLQFTRCESLYLETIGSVKGGLGEDSRWPTAISVAHNMYSSIALAEWGNDQRFISTHAPASYSKDMK
jgi:hypothetical protein